MATLEAPGPAESAECAERGSPNFVLGPDARLVRFSSKSGSGRGQLFQWTPSFSRAFTLKVQFLKVQFLKVQFLTVQFLTVLFLKVEFLKVEFLKVKFFKVNSTLLQPDLYI